MTYQLDTKLHARDLFGSLQPEKEQEPDRKLEIKTNPNLEYLVREYQEFIKKATYYEEAKKLCDQLNFKDISSKDIEMFSIVLGKHQQSRNFRYSGIYLSRAINNSADKEFVVHTNYLDSLISFLGYENNGKIITINGNAGNGVGWFMKNGAITINGNAGDTVGYYMKKGLITVKGNAGDSVGDSMKGGNIYLKQEYKSISDNISGGNIYYKRKLIVKDGIKIGGKKK